MFYYSSLLELMWLYFQGQSLYYNATVNTSDFHALIYAGR